MKIAVSGSTGFIGSLLKSVRQERNWEIVPLLRTDFARGTDALREKLRGCTAVVNLAGATIAARWTERYKNELYMSRVPLTSSLVSAMSVMENRPAVFVSVSGVGIYPDGGPWIEDDTDRADTFLGRLAQDWEQAALVAQDHAIRTVVFRLGVVLGRQGGALAKMLPLFRLGLGGVIGNGLQQVSWVHAADLVSAMCSACENEALHGVFNLCAPQSTTNWELTRTIARALNRPAFLPVPVFALKLAFGEGAAVLLDGQAALPQRLQDAGFVFTFHDIEAAIADLLGS